MGLFIDEEGREVQRWKELDFLEDDIGVVLGRTLLDRGLDAILQKKSTRWYCRECDPDTVPGGCQHCQAYIWD